jgi:hypothetical protein
VANDVSITDFDPKDGVKRDGIELTAHINDVGQDFFTAMRIPILFGRGFNADDTETAPKVAVVNQTLAKQFFPNQNPIGKTFNDEHIEIVGVCADAQYDSMRQVPPATFYVPYRQMEDAGGLTYEIRTHTNAASILAGIRAAVQSIDRDLPLVDVRTQTEQIDATMQQERIFATLTAGFGVLALILAGVGIYGLMAYNVARRTNEIGVRMALGAQRSVIGRMVLRETFGLVLVGVVIGVPAAWPASCSAYLRTIHSRSGQSCCFFLRRDFLQASCHRAARRTWIPWSRCGTNKKLLAGYHDRLRAIRGKRQGDVRGFLWTNHEALVPVAE